MRQLLSVVLLSVCVFQYAVSAQEGVAAFETPPKFKFSELHPGIPAESALYQVGDIVANDGMMNHYYIFTDTTTYIPEGDELFLERLHELKVIQQFEETKKGKAYGEGIKAAGKSTWNNMKTIFTEPVKTISGVPAGVKRFFGNTARTIKGENKSEHEDSAAKEMIKFSKVKRELAFQAGVDPYSSNEQLQTALDDITWASYAGGMSLTAVQILVVPPIISAPVSVTNATVQASELIRTESPANLASMNTEKLENLGVPNKDIQSLMSNGVWSPRRTTLLVQALDAMGKVKNIAAYVGKANEALTENEAYYMHRSAQLLMAVHTTNTPLAELHMLANVPIFETTDNKLVAAFAVDHLIWSERLFDSLVAMREALPARLANAPLTVYILGGASAQAKEELAKREINIIEHAFPTLATK